MSTQWHVAKLFFEWIPEPLPVNTRQDGDFLLVSSRVNPEVIYLNKPAAFVFSRCDGKQTVEDIVKDYMVEFLRADRETAAYEVAKMLRHLDRRLAIVLMPPPEFQPSHPPGMAMHENGS